MKLLKQFIFLTVCGLMTVRGVVAMGDSAGVVDETAVAFNRKIRAEIKANEIRTHLCPTILIDLRKYSPLLDRLSYDPCFNYAAIDSVIDAVTEGRLKNCTDGELLLWFITAKVVAIADKVALSKFSDQPNYESAKKDREISECQLIDDILDPLTLTPYMHMYKNLVIDHSVDSIDEASQAFARSVHILTDILTRFANYYGDDTNVDDMRGFFNLVEDIRGRLITFAENVFSVGTAREIVQEINFSLNTCLGVFRMYREYTAR